MNLIKKVRSLYAIEIVLHQLNILVDLKDPLVIQTSYGSFEITNLNKFKKLLGELQPQFKYEFNNILKTAMTFGELCPISYVIGVCPNIVEIQFNFLNFKHNPLVQITKYSEMIYTTLVPFSVLFTILSQDPTMDVSELIEKTKKSSYYIYFNLEF